MWFFDVAKSPRIQRLSSMRKDVELERSTGPRIRRHRISGGH